MEGENIGCFHKQTQSGCHIRKQRQDIQELQPVEYVDLILPKEEKNSTDSENETKNQRHKFFVKKLRVK